MNYPEGFKRLIDPLPARAILVRVRAPTRSGVLVSTLLSCSFPDPTFVDGAGGGGAGGSATAGSSGACVADCEPQLVAEGQGEVIAIAANSSRVYWVTRLGEDNAAELRSAAAAGAAIEIVTNEGLGWSAEALVVDETNAFVANQSSGGTLLGVRLSDGMTIWDYMQERIDTLVLDATVLFYSSPYAVVRLPTVGPSTGARLDLTDGGPRLLMQDEDYLILLDQSEERLPPRRVVRLRSDGSESLAEATVLLDDAADFDSACADANAYYFADPEEGEIVKLARADANALEPLAREEAVPRNLHLHAGVLYWTTEAGSQVRSVSTAGGRPVTWDDAASGVLTTETSGVFWATLDGKIRRLAP